MMKPCRTFFLISVLGWTLSLPALAADETRAPVTGGVMELAAAYQSGYLQLTALSCFQIYSSLGIIAGDFQGGVIDGGQALEALDYTSLLHSACHTTLSSIRELTPDEDTLAHAEFTRLQAMLDAEQQLLSTLSDWFVEPSAQQAAATEQARAATEAAINAYTDQDAPAAGSPL